MFFPSRTVVVELAGFSVHWYGFLYLLAFIAAWIMLPILAKYRGLHLSKDERASLLIAAIIGVIVGGRLGYVVLYEPLYFLHNPLDIVALWQGGMSSHGGFIGFAIALFIFSRLHQIRYLALLDIVVIPAALGLAFGRLGNFINQELYGLPTTLPWGIHIPGKEGLHHPTHLYAVIKDVGIAGACAWYLQKKPQEGQVTALFLILYSVLRFLVEFVRVQDYPMVALGGILLSRGQVLTIPIFIVGLILMMRLKKNTSS